MESHKEQSGNQIATAYYQLRQSRLKTILDGCKDVLTDLKNFIKRYYILETQAKRTWDRMKWGNEDVAEIRGRLVSNITLPGVFIGKDDSLNLQCRPH